MYLYLGDDLIVSAADVVTIVDARLLDVSAANRRLVQEALRRGQLRGQGLKGCKALVVTTREIYASTISAQSLAKRLAGFHPA